MDTKTFKQELLNQLYAPYKNCKACPLGSLGRTRVVFGEGNPDTQLLFIGEGPGKDEDEQGRPFVGRSGQLLNKALEIVGIQRSEIFITNIVKCRPPGNRLPTEKEASTCMSLLLFNQIKIIRPKIICTLGSCAFQSLFGSSAKEPFKITKSHGQLFKKNDLLVIPLYHPAYILRNQTELPAFINDMKIVKENMANL